mgnify:CR=1 FL=1
MASTRQNVVDPYHKFAKQLKVLTTQDLQRIEEVGATMTLEECLSLFFLLPSQLSETETEIVNLALLRGKSLGIKKASEKLFSNMSDSKQGIQACLSYLKRFSSEFRKEVDDSEGGLGGVIYNVNISSEPKEKQEPTTSLKTKGVVRSIK